jgi:hypothetical protein
MDKIKPYLALLKKHHFWLLAIVVVALSGYAWYAGTGAYVTQFEANRGQINSAFSTIQTHANAQNPPNQTFADSVKESQKKQVKSTLAAWQILYDQQKDLLTWPEHAKEMASLPRDAEASDATRRYYMQYFAQNVFQPLFQIVDPLRESAEPAGKEPAAPAAVAPAPARTGGGRPRRGMDIGGGAQPGGMAAGAPAATGQSTGPKMLGIVDFPLADQTAILDRYNWGGVIPSTAHVRVAQEDYWLYKSLFEVIADTNKSAGATSHRNAAVKKIDKILLAQEALTQSPPALEGLSKEILGQVDTSSLPKGASAKSTDEELLNGRYIDPASNAPSPAMPAGEYRLVPVILRLTMDERRIPNLLVACANSRLPIEVRQVSYNPGASLSSGGGGGAPRSGGMGGMGGMRPAMPATPAARPSSGSSEVKTEANMYDVPVEVRGVVYLFNPPDAASLGVEVAPEAGADGAAPDAGATDGAAVEGAPADAATPPATEPAAEPAPDAAAPDGAAPDAAAPATEPPADNAAPVEAAPAAEGAAPADPGAAPAAPAEPAAAQP